MGARHSFWGVLGPAEAKKFDRQRAARAGYPVPDTVGKGVDPASVSPRQADARANAPSMTADLIGILGEVNRLAARCQSVFGTLREESGLSGIELLTLIAIVHSDVPPTVPQVGRSLGHPRQVIQRAVRVLEQRGLVETLPNPGHKRASLLAATSAGNALGRRIDAGTRRIVEEIGQGMDAQSLAATHDGLLALRERIDAWSGDRSK